jgi:hypothetical protein
MADPSGHQSKPKIKGKPIYGYPGWPIYDGNPLKWGYGNYCGLKRVGGDGKKYPPYDDIDACCQDHDNCMPDIGSFICKNAECKYELCACLAGANCKTSECRDARRDMWSYFCQAFTDPPP